MVCINIPRLQSLNLKGRVANLPPLPPPQQTESGARAAEVIKPETQTQTLCLPAPLLLPEMAYLSNTYTHKHTLT